MKCWEFKKCGREKGGDKEHEMGVCAAYPDFGDCCAPVVGTMCGDEIQGTYARKLDNCINCDFYKSEHYNRLKTIKIMDEMSERNKKEE